MKEIKLSDLKSGMFVKIKDVLHLVVEAVSEKTNKPCVFFIAEDGFMNGEDYKEDLTNIEQEWNITDVYVPASCYLRSKNFINSRSIHNVIRQETKDIEKNLIKIYSRYNVADWNFFLEKSNISNERIKEYILNVFQDNFLCFEKINKYSLEKNNTFFLFHINGVLEDLSTVAAARNYGLVTDTMKAAVVIFEVQKIIRITEPYFAFNLDRVSHDDFGEISWYVKVLDCTDVKHNASEESKIIYLTRLLRTL